MPYLHLIDEAIGLLNTEIRLIEWRIKYPEQLKQRIEKQSLSPLYLADKTALINIMEMVAFYLIFLFFHNCHELIIFCHRTYREQRKTTDSDKYAPSISQELYSSVPMPAHR